MFVLQALQRLFGLEGCTGSWGDDGGQPTLQFGNSGSGPRCPSTLLGWGGTTAKILYPRTQSSPIYHDDGDTNASNWEGDTAGVGYSPYNTLKQWSEHLISRRYPDKIPPFNIQPLNLRMYEVSALLALTGDGCREADVGSNALEVCLLEAKVEAKRWSWNTLVGYPSRLVIFVLCGDSADI